MRPYEVDLAQRIKDLLGEYRDAGPDTEFTYSWDHGYERYTIHNDGEGSANYAGAYHPGEGYCDTGTTDDVGVCIHCGRTLM